jgi:hypothetical protein
VLAEGAEASDRPLLLIGVAEGFVGAEHEERDHRDDPPDGEVGVVEVPFEGEPYEHPPGEYSDQAPPALAAEQQKAGDRAGEERQADHRAAGRASRADLQVQGRLVVVLVEHGGAVGLDRRECLLRPVLQIVHHEDGRQRSRDDEQNIGDSGTHLCVSSLVENKSDVRAK